MDKTHEADTIQTVEKLHETIPTDAADTRVIFDRYEVLEELGKGGAGAVYKVRHVHLGKILALKVLQPRSSDEAGTIRFQQEAQAASLLDHPNIVNVYDFGVSAMESRLSSWITLKACRSNN